MTSVAARAPVAEPIPAGVFAGVRVLITHEWLYGWGGAEQCLEQMLRVFPDADLLVGIATAAMRQQHDLARRAEEIWVSRLPGAHSRYRWFFPLHAAAFASYDTTDYDLVLSASHSFAKFVRSRGRAVHLCYCYSPPRYLWDLQATYEAHASKVQALALRMGAPMLRALDQRAARGVDRFISISRYVAARVRASYGRESEVVYPPVAAKGVGNSPVAVPSEPYLLYVGRLVEYKRVDLVIQAAGRLRMQLVVVGDGTMRRALEQIAGPNVEFRGIASDPECAALLSRCAAFVYAGEEDFGIAVVEANAHGRPVVCYRRGGASETMVDGETAIMFDRQDVESVCAAIEACLSRSWDRERLVANARRFSPDQFRAGIARAAARALSR